MSHTFMENNDNDNKNNNNEREEERSKKRDEILFAWWLKLEQNHDQKIDKAFIWFSYQQSHLAGWISPAWILLLAGYHHS